MDDRDESDRRDLPPPDPELARKVNRRADMGPGAHGGGFAGQRADWDGSPRHGYQEGGSAHLSGVHGEQAFGRIGPGDGRVRPDPSQRQVPGGVDGGINTASPGGGTPRTDNAQIVGASPDSPIAGGGEDERSSPGIATDKSGDDSRG